MGLYMGVVCVAMMSSIRLLASSACQEVSAKDLCVFVSVV